MSRESLEGAAAIMVVAGQLREMLDGDSEQRCDEYFARKDAAIAAMLAAAGPLPDRAAGALQAVIEILVGQIQNDCEYDLKEFEPEAGMTEDRRREFRQWYFDAEAEDLRLEASCSNVVQLHH